MARVRRLVPRPVHQIVAQSPDEWRAEGSDPQFRLDGPFARGLWELTFTAGAPIAADHDSVRIYYWCDGGLSETASIRFPGIGQHRTRRTLRFWLPRDTAWLRLDPTESPGHVHFGTIDAVLRSPAVAIIRGAFNRLRQAPLDAVEDFRRILSATWRDRHERNRLLIALALAEHHDRSYERWLAGRVATRLSEYPARSEEGVFSLLTTAFNTPASYIDALGASVVAQTWTDFEWVILDNGSESAATRAALARLARDPRVRLFRSEKNLGIIGGMRYALERASNRYVLPVDSDDYLFPDALSIIASFVQQHGSPPLLYSDEDKLQGASHTDAFFKPDWDPVLFRNCCYIAHLCAIDRQRAIQLGAYTDGKAEGCHDWDTFLRFVRAGAEAVHVPEILYSWRMHPLSTAADAASKNYIVESQKHVLESHAALSGLSDRLEVVRSPFFPASPDWWFHRKRVTAPPGVLVLRLSHHHGPAQLPQPGGYPVASVWLIGGDEDAATSIDEQARLLYPDATIERVSATPSAALARASHTTCALIVVIDGVVSVQGDDWLWEMIGLKESFPDAVMIGGRLLDEDGRVLRAAGIFGLGEGTDSPDRGRPARDAGYFGTALKQRSTDVVSGLFCAYEPAFLRTVGLDQAANVEAVALAVSVRARETGRRVVFSPFVEGRTRSDQLQSCAGAASSVPYSDRYYHWLLSREPDYLFRPRI